MAIHIGCGSWADPEYVGVLYPRGWPQNERLRGYAQWFDRIELNASYHRLPTPEMIAGWAEQTPAGFLFDIKLPKDFSDNAGAAIKAGMGDRVLRSIQPLLDAKKFGAFLFTLAPSFSRRNHRLEELDGVVEKLRPHRMAVELRHRDWVEADALPATLEYFRSRKLAWVALDLPALSSPKLLPAIDEVTHPQLAYMRLHGRNPDYLNAKDAAGRHHHDYTEVELEEIAGRIRTLGTRAKDVHVSVNNHALDFAPKAALALRRLLGQSVRTEPLVAPTKKSAKGELSLFD